MNEVVLTFNSKCVWGLVGRESSREVPYITLKLMKRKTQHIWDCTNVFEMGRLIKRSMNMLTKLFLKTALIKSAGNLIGKCAGCYDYTK